MSDQLQRSALAHRSPLLGDGELRLAELARTGLVALRGAPAAVATPVRETLQLDLPLAVRETAAAPHVTALWQGPDEWLLVVADGDAAAVAERLNTALAGVHHQAVDVSDNFTAIELSGRHGRDLLAKLVTIDLHRRSFHAAEAVATRLAKAEIRLWLTADETLPSGLSFTIFVRRSFADYVWCLLADAGREWGLPAQEPIGRVPLHGV